MSWCINRCSAEYPRMFITQEYSEGSSPSKRKLGRMTGNYEAE